MCIIIRKRYIQQNYIVFPYVSFFRVFIFAKDPRTLECTTEDYRKSSSSKRVVIAALVIAALTALTAIYYFCYCYAIIMEQVKCGCFPVIVGVSNPCTSNIYGIIMHFVQLM